MRVASIALIFALSSCSEFATDFGLNDFYLNCHNDVGEFTDIFYVDLGRNQITRLDEDGNYYLVCDGCDTLISNSTIKWTKYLENGIVETTDIDRYNGRMSIFSRTISDTPVKIGNVDVPAELLGTVITRRCERAGSPPEAKF